MYKNKKMKGYEMGLICQIKKDGKARVCYGHRKGGGNHAMQNR